MQDDEVQRWLAEYAESSSETAFRALVGHYLDFVYSIARRKVGGDAHLARDVTQQVFIDLAHKATTLRGAALGGWLHRDTCFRSATVVRAEIRRRLREQKAVAMIALAHEARSTWERIAPLLDDALDALPRRDRDAIVLRFFEQRSFAEVARNLRTTEAAAQKRVARGLQKLRAYFSRRGVAASADTVGATLVTQAVHAAPAELYAETVTLALSAPTADAADGWAQVAAYHLCRHAGFLATAGAAAALAWLALLGTGRQSLRGETAPLAVTELTSAAMPAAASPPPSGAITAANEASRPASAQREAPSLPPLSAFGERPPASLVLAHMLKTYGECRTYLGSGTIKQTIVYPERKRTVESSFSTVFVRPDRLRYESYDTRHGRPDSFVIWTNAAEAHIWWDIANPHEWTTTWDNAFTGAAVHSHVGNAYVAQALEPMRFDRRPLQELLAPTGLSGTESVEGTECFRLPCWFGSDELILWVDKTSLLLRKAYWQHDFGNFLSQHTVLCRPTIDADIPDELLKFDPPRR